jgi:uncharacterized repeat protein (TIGR03803 family)
VRNLRGFSGLIFTTALLTACSGSGVNPAVRSAAPISAGAPAAARATAGYTSLYHFKGTPDGASPYSGLVAVGGTLYGTTLNGSSNYCSQSCGGNYCYLGCGTIFSVTQSGTEHVVYNFKGDFNSAQDGSWPFPGMTLMNGSFYGTAASAGAYTHGAVYAADTGGSEHVVYSFQGGNDGEDPEAALTAYKSKLYGTTVYGGGSGCGGAGCGVVFWANAAGKEHVLYRFQGGNDGMRLYAGVTRIGKNFYGAALEGGGGACGSTGCGIIFKINLKGKETVLHRFANTGDGAYPNGLTAVNGVLYGTTEGGGTRNSGTFFSITTSGTLTTLYNFKDIPDGNLPGANLIDVKGTLYGTTVGGGTAGIGTVYSITTSGAESVLYSFQGGTSDGSDPQGPLYLFKGYLYGTTTTGGGTGCTNNAGCGTIFRVKP